MSRPILAGLVLSALLFPLPLPAADPPAVEAPHGMVVAAERAAAEAGVRMLDLGGNAIDAAVATGFALAVTYPVAGNLGGGGFLVARVAGEGENAEPQVVALDFRETAPAAASADMYVMARLAGRPDASTLGPLAAGVPGSVAGLLEALERWGTLPRETVLAPAISLAEDGFPMTRRTAGFLAADSIRDRMLGHPETARVFYPDGAPPAEGAPFRQPDLAATLRRIASEGRAGFYEGETATRIVSAMGDSGIISLEDLSEYRPVVRTPVSFSFAGRTIVSMPPPSSGGICLQQMLTMLEGRPLRAYGHNSSATLHLLAEAMRRSFADRNAHLGDPDHVEIPLDRLLDPARLAERAKSISPGKATPSAEVGADLAVEESEQTTHYSVVDRDGNAVSVTTTLNGAFGSMVTVPGAGFLLNNEMDDFSANPGKANLYGLVQGVANAVAPGKRPLSSMTPTLVLAEDGAVEAVLGTPGGPTIITNVLQVLLNLLVFELEPQAAVNAPKIHHQHLPDRLEVESEIPADVRAALQGRGHSVRERSWIGDFQLIVVDRARGVRLGATDPRGGGAAVGH